MHLDEAFVPTPPPWPPGFALSAGSPAPRPQSSSVAIPSRRRRHPCPHPAFANPFGNKSRAFYLGRIELVERRKLPDHVVEKHFAPLVQRDVTRAEIETAVENVNKWFVNNDFPCSRLAIVRMPGILRKTLVLYCIEPNLTAVNLVPVDKEVKPVQGGTLSTRRHTILNALRLKLNETFQWKADGFAALMALGIFEYADAEVKQSSRDGVELTLKLRERPSCRIEPGAGMTSDGRVYGDISYIDTNFMGRAQRMHLEWQKRVDMGRSSGGLMFEDHRIGARVPISYKIGAYRNSNSTRRIPGGRRSRSVAAMGEERHQHIPDGRFVESLRYERDRDGVMMEVSYRPGRRHFMISSSPLVENILPNLADRSGGRSTLQAVLQTSITHITRLPVDLPSFGHLFRVEHSVGKVFSATSQPFQKTLLRLAQYFKVGTHGTIAVGGSLGFGTENLPWHEQKSLGGPMNVRGYSYGELGRYKTFGIGRMELRVPLTKGAGVDDSEGKKANAQGERGTLPPTATEESGKESTGNLISPKMFDRLPPLVGVLFGDVAVANAQDRDPLGSSYGLGLRIGGIVTVDWIRTADGRKSRLHFGLVDRNL